MPVRPLIEAKEVLGKHASVIQSLSSEAFKKYLQDMGPALKTLDTRTKRGAVRDFIVEGLWPWAEDTPGVQPFKKGNLKWIGFENNWIVRAKWLNDKDGVSVSPTKESRAYDRNEIPEVIKKTLLEDSPATALYLGWRTNENTPTVPEISFVCNNSSSKPEWIWPLLGDGDPQTGLPLPLPETGNIGAGVSVKVRAPNKDSGTG